MNRPKFRVWSKKRNAWLTDNDHSLHCTSNWMMNIFTGEIIDVTLVGEEYYPDPEPKFYRLGSEIIIKSPFVVQQWTGLLDVANIEIYDGDIVQYTLSNSEFTDIVEWSNNSWQLRGIQIDSNCPICGAYDMKIIGNNFENPELLNTTI